MANHEAYQKVFYPGRPHGIKGEIKYNACFPFNEEMETLDVVFIAKGKAYIPYFVEAIQLLSDDTCYIQFEDIKSKEDAMNFCKQALFLPENELEKYFDLEESDYLDLIDYTCKTATGQLIGTIVDIEEFPGQVLAKIQRGDKAVLVPLADELIVSIDDEKQEIILNLASGYLETFES